MECRLCRLEDRVKLLEKQVDDHHGWITFVSVTTLVGLGSILVIFIERGKLI